MTKFKVKRKRKLPETYFREREIRELRKKHKGEIPIGEYVQTGYRVSARYPRKTHRVNQIVLYKGKRYIVRKVSKKGVHLSTIKRKNGLIEGFKFGKPKFVPEKKYSGQAVPEQPVWVFAPA